MPSWVLRDVEEIAELNPTRVFVPERGERRAQQVGDEVRLHFHLVAPEPPTRRRAGCSGTRPLRRGQRLVPRESD